MKRVLMGALLALVCCHVCPQEVLPLSKPFPAYKVLSGRLADGGFPVSGARLCLREGNRSCFTMPSSRIKSGADDERDFFGLYPKAEPFAASPLGELVLFYASTGGGSGSGYRYALLECRDGTLRDLFPAILVSNNSDHALWNLPETSSMPVFVTADFIWDALEAHYGNHRYTIRAYVFDPSSAKYRRVLQYETARKYRSADMTDDRQQLDSVHVLGPEREEIMRRLATAISRR